MANTAVTKIGNAVITDHGIKGLEQVSQAVFIECGKQLASIEQGLQWAIGDWYNNIEGKLNQYSGEEGKAGACNAVGLNYKTAQDYGRVAKIFSMPSRNGMLSFKHHRVLAGEDLSSLDRRRLLKRAAKGDEVESKDGSITYKPWSSARLRKERDIILGIAPPSPTRDYNNGIDALEESVIDSLPAGTSKAMINKVVRGLRKEAEKLKHEFSQAVEREAEAKAKIARENMKKAQARADEQYEKAIKMAAGVKAYMSRAEFQLIRSCLHPDKNSHPKAGKAFDIFNRLADVKDW